MTAKIWNRKNLQLEELLRIDDQPEDSIQVLELDFPLRQKVYEDLQNYSMQEPYKELPPLKGLRNYDECEDSELSGLELLVNLEILLSYCMSKLYRSK